MKDVLLSGKVGGTEICQIIVNSADPHIIIREGRTTNTTNAMHLQPKVLSSELQNEEVNVPYSGTRMYNINSI